MELEEALNRRRLEWKEILRQNKEAEEASVAKVRERCKLLASDMSQAVLAETGLEISPEMWTVELDASGACEVSLRRENGTVTFARKYDFLELGLDTTEIFPGFHVPFFWFRIHNPHEPAQWRVTHQGKFVSWLPSNRLLDAILLADGAEGLV